MSAAPYRAGGSYSKRENPAVTLPLTHSPRSGLVALSRKGRGVSRSGDAAAMIPFARTHH